MRFSKYVFILSAFALLLSAGALAKSNNQRKVKIANTVEVGNTQLQPGTYKLEWTGNGPNVNVEFLKDGKTVATAPAHWVDKSQPAAYDSVTTTKADDNRDRLVEIDFHNQREALQINSAGQRHTGM